MNQITNSACYLLDLLNSFFQLGVIFEDNSYNHRAFIMLFTFSKDMLNLNVVSRDLKLSASLTV